VDGPLANEVLGCRAGIIVPVLDPRDDKHGSWRYIQDSKLLRNL
jgi:hypothetical protein